MSMTYEVKKINDVKVKKVKCSVAQDDRPIRGSDLFGEIYANIFLCAKKKSGKTSTIYKIIKECMGKKTKVIAFVSTLHKDATWKSIREYCEGKGNEFIGHTSLKEDGEDLLDTLVKELESEAEKEYDDNNIDERLKQLERKLCPVLCEVDSDDDEPKKKRERKEKYQSPEYLILLDDLSNELKSKSLVSLLKKNRHFKAKIIVSSQYLNDLLPESRKQQDYFLVFKGQSNEKLEEIRRDADVGLEEEELRDVYKFATEKQFSFLYIDTRNNTFRRNFNYLIQIR